MVSIDALLYALEFDVLTRQELLQREEAWLVLSLIVVPVLDLTLEGGKLDCLVASARVGTINNGVSGLNVEKVQLHWIVTINVLIRKEELFSESEYDCFLDALFTKRLLSVEPVHCTQTSIHTYRCKDRANESLLIDTVGWGWGTLSYRCYRCWRGKLYCITLQVLTHNTSSKYMCTCMYRGGE